MTERNEFNKAAGDTDAERAMRRRRSSGMSVINYTDIDKVFSDDPKEGQVMKDKMEDFMAGIDRDPKDFDTIIEFGAPPIREIGKVADGVIKASAQFGEQLRVIQDANKNVGGVFGELGIEEVIGGLKKMMVGTANAGVKGALGLGKLMKRISNAVTGAERKKTEEQKHIDAMIDKLPAANLRMIKVGKDLKEAAKGLEAVIDQAKILGQARVDSVRELNIYLGAAPEVLRRYNEVYIKEAKLDYDASQSPEDELRLSDIMKAKDYFMRQHNLLESSAAQALVAAQKLKNLIEAMREQQLTIRQNSETRENEWKALLADANLSASSLKAAVIMAESGETGNEIHRLAMDMDEKTRELTLAQEGRGTVDHKLLLESLERMSKGLAEADKVREKRQLDDEAIRLQTRAAAEKLNKTIEEVRNHRILDAAPESVEKAVKPTPVANDNAEAKDGNAVTPPKKANGGPTR